MQKVSFVMYLVSMSKIGSTEIAPLVCRWSVSAALLDYIINRTDNKGGLLHSEGKGQEIDFALLRS